MVEFGRSQPGVLVGSAIDPHLWFTVHMDRETVEILAASLRAAPPLDGMSMLETFEEWLTVAQWLHRSHLTVVDSTGLHDTNDWVGMSLEPERRPGSWPIHAR